ncbi:LOW QUALITY PROTEIN: uncharacterized protein V5649_004800 [Rhynchonycteris naso]
MGPENQSSVSEFLFLGLPMRPGQQRGFFTLFLGMYLTTVLGNLLIILLIRLDSRLHTPMYFFLSHLAFSDISLSSVTVPKMLTNMQTRRQSIPYVGCIAQMYFFMCFAGVDNFLLAVMAYDRYVAICHPLHYTTIMREGLCVLLVAGSWIVSCAHALLHTLLLVRLSFCADSTISHFFCDLTALLKLSCSDISLNELVIFTKGGIFLFLPLDVVLGSVCIGTIILRFPSTKRLFKALSTCGSHLLVVSLYYGTLTSVNIFSSSWDSKDITALVMYMVVTPMLNPFIYSRRNRDIKALEMCQQVKIFKWQSLNPLIAVRSKACIEYLIHNHVPGASWERQLRGLEFAGRQYKRLLVHACNHKHLQHSWVLGVRLLSWPLDKTLTSQGTKVRQVSHLSPQCVLLLPVPAVFVSESRQKMTVKDVMFLGIVSRLLRVTNHLPPQQTGSSMGPENQSSVSEFLLLGLPMRPGQQRGFFTLFLGMYLTTVLGNLLIILLIRLDSRLHTPMYFFLSHLAFSDISLSSVTVPKMLTNMQTRQQSIPYVGCIVQVYFYILFCCVDNFLLAVMAYDRYVAICHPLHYTTIMREGLCVYLVAASWILSCGTALLHTLLLVRLSFCVDNTISHFFCDLAALLKLSCFDISLNKLVIFTEGGMVLFLPLGVILGSYVYIGTIILRVPSTVKLFKAFSTCGSHLLVVFLYYGALAGVYFFSSSWGSKDIIASIMYTVITPMLNPFIYSLRNRHIKQALEMCVNSVNILMWQSLNPHIAVRRK